MSFRFRSLWENGKRVTFHAPGLTGARCLRGATYGAPHDDSPPPGEGMEGHSTTWRIIPGLVSGQYPWLIGPLTGVIPMAQKVCK